MNLNNRSSIMNSNMLCFLRARVLSVCFSLLLSCVFCIISPNVECHLQVSRSLPLSRSPFVSAPRHQLLSFIHRSKKTRHGNAIEYADDTWSSSRWSLSRFETNHFHLHTAMGAQSNKIVLHLSRRCLIEVFRFSFSLSRARAFPRYISE